MGSSNAAVRLLIAAMICSLISSCGTKGKYSEIDLLELMSLEEDKPLFRNKQKRSIVWEEEKDFNREIVKHRTKRSAKWKCGRNKIKKYCCRNCNDFKKNFRKRRDCHLCHYKVCNRIITILRTFRCAAGG